MLAIALAVGASLCWGSGDFLGGLTARRASLWVVIIGSQAVGLAGALAVTLGTGHGWPGFAAVWPARSIKTSILSISVMRWQTFLASRYFMSCHLMSGLYAGTLPIFWLL